MSAAPLCPACGLPAVEVSIQERPQHEHQLTGTCKKGHLWVTAWFEPEAS